jgi:hypothetical protein
MQIGALGDVGRRHGDDPFGLDVEGSRLESLLVELDERREEIRLELAELTEMLRAVVMVIRIGHEIPPKKNQGPA